MYGEYEKALAGLKYGLESDIVTAAAKAIIQFGEPVLRAVGDDLGGYALDKITLTFSADFVASNVIAGSILGSAVSVTFATSHAATFAALVAALDAVTDVTIVASDATARTITLSTAGKATALALTVTAGDSQAALAISLPADRVLGGIALRVQKAKVSEVLGARYDVTEAVPVMVEGGIWVEASKAVASFAKAYLTTAGKFTDSAVGSIATKYSFASSTTAAGLVQLTVIK